MASISLCMIVKDEEAVLERCLEAAARVVDEICVVHTGSGARTLEIARERADRVVQLEWNEDFSTARNASLALAEGDWVLVLDADETIDVSARDALEDFAATHADGKHAGQIRIDDAPHPEAGLEASSSWVTRFFPRSSSPEFRGRIHEQLYLNGRPPVRGRTGAAVRHDGYTREGLASKDKLERNERMLLDSLAEDAADPYLWWQLGRTQAVAGRHEKALESFASALDIVAPQAPFLASLCESTCYSLRALGRHEEALGLISDISTGFQDRADTLFLEALLSMDLGQLERADRGFRRCIELAGTHPTGGPTSPSASTYAPAYNLGVMREVLGRHDEARDFYRLALSMGAGHEPSREGLERLDAGDAG